MRLYDTLSGEQRELVPAGDKVKMYVCGITPYAPCHVGHAMSYIIFDVLRRYLEFRGYQVQHLQNFTDVDDKIIQRAQQEGVSIQDLAEHYIAEFLANMDSLNVLRAHQYPRATEEIPRIVEIISTLMEKGYAYQSNGDVYFRVSRASGYGKLGHRTHESMLAGARVEPDAAKEDPVDFALWKGAKAGEPFWSSPWGPGRPGWHIECTTMSLIYLGETLDIHGGGQDLVFPHHENELAQSEAYTSKTPFVGHWVHNGLLHMGEDKMSKSLGNLVSVTSALKQHGSDAFRLFFLSSHYTSPQTYSEDGFIAMERAAERLRTPLRQFSQDGDVDGLDPEPYQERFIRAMDSDLNTPQALAVLYDLAHEINREAEASKGIGAAQQMLLKLGGVLGLTFKGSRPEEGQAIEPFVVLLINTRTELRAANQYTLADTIRSGLADLGIILEDTSRGTIWRYQE